MTAHNHRFKTTLALTLALGAITPAAASARVDLNPGTAGATPPSTPAAQIIRVTAPSGFDWGDAGIGAAGGFGLSMLALGGGLGIAQRRGRRYATPR
jgi:hypothetical protein